MTGVMLSPDGEPLGGAIFNEPPLLLVRLILGFGVQDLEPGCFRSDENVVSNFPFGIFVQAAGDRTFKLHSGITSEYGRYVKSLGDPVAGRAFIRADASVRDGSGRDAMCV